MCVRNLQLAKPLTCFVVLILAVFANNLMAQDEGHNVLMTQEMEKMLKESTAKLNRKELELRRQQQLSANQLQVLEASQKLAIREQTENEIDRSLVSDFWIGVQVEKAGTTSFSPKEAPDSDLNIDGGLIILSVSEGGAADEAGLKKDDVLLKFAGKPMNSMNDLFAVVGETEGNKADLVLIRESEIFKLQITPQPRPEETESNDNSNAVHGLWTIEEAYRNELKVKQLPEGYTLKIELVRGEDIMFEVTNGDGTWKASEASINELPEPIQAFVEQLAEHCEPLVEENQQPAWQTQPVKQWQIHLQNTHEDRLKSIEQKLKELKKELNKGILQLAKERKD